MATVQGIHARRDGKGGCDVLALRKPSRQYGVHHRRPSESPHAWGLGMNVNEMAAKVGQDEVRPIEGLVLGASLLSREKVLQCVVADEDVSLLEPDGVSQCLDTDLVCWMEGSDAIAVMLMVGCAEAVS